MAVTMKDIAQKAGCSIATVSKVVNHRDEHISEPTRQRIWTLVKECGYKPNALAKGLKLRHSNTVGFILPDITNPYFPAIARGIEDVAKARNFSVIYYNTDGDPDMAQGSMSFMRSRMVDGLIIMSDLLYTVPQQELDPAIPTVLLGMDAPPVRGDVGLVYTNTESAMEELTTLLLNEGCRRVGLLCAQPDDDFSRKRGYTKALEKKGVPFDPELVRPAGFEVGAAVEATKALVELGADGIVCGNDFSAAGVLSAVHELGVSVPSQMKVAGLGDIQVAQFSTPPLTTMSQPAYDLGSVAAKMLMEHILDGAPFSAQELPYHLVRRRSA